MRIPKLGRIVKPGEKGQSMVEYILIVVVVVLVALGAYKMFGTAVKKKVDDATKEIK